jgi:hypothetical protein
MPRVATFRDHRDLFAGDRIDDAEIPVTLIRHKQHGT